jgi:hypothetical protein
MSEYGIDVERKGSVSFDAGSMTIKLELRTASGAKALTAQAGFAAVRLGFGENPIGKRFNSPTPGGKARWYVITEINLRRPKYPITAKRESSGKSFKFKADYVKRQLEMI